MHLFGKQILLGTLALTGVLVLTGCDTMTEEPEPRIELEPHAVGNRWDHLIAPFDLPFQDTLTTEIGREVQVPINGKTVSAFTRREYFNGRLRTLPDVEFLYANREDGVYQIGGLAQSDTILFESLAFPYPAQVGDTGTLVQFEIPREEPRQWEITDTLMVEVLATDEQIETPAGVFSSYLYKYYLPEECASVGNDIYLYYVPGIGRVARTITGAGDLDNLIQRSKLYAYEIDESNNKAGKKQHAKTMVLPDSAELMYDRNDIASFGAGDPGFDDTRGRAACNAGG